MAARSTPVVVQLGHLKGAVYFATAARGGTLAPLTPRANAVHRVRATGVAQPTACNAGRVFKVVGAGGGARARVVVGLCPVRLVRDPAAVQIGHQVAHTVGHEASEGVPHEVQRFKIGEASKGRGKSASELVAIQSQSTGQRVGKREPDCGGNGAGETVSGQTDAAREPALMQAALIQRHVLAVVDSTSVGGGGGGGGRGDRVALDADIGVGRRAGCAVGHGIELEGANATEKAARNLVGGLQRTTAVGVLKAKDAGGVLARELGGDRAVPIVIIAAPALEGGEVIGPVDVVRVQAHVAVFAAGDVPGAGAALAAAVAAVPVAGRGVELGCCVVAVSIAVEGAREHAAAGSHAVHQLGRSCHRAEEQRRFGAFRAAGDAAA